MRLDLSLALSTPQGGETGAPGPQVFLVAGQSNSTARAPWDGGQDWPEGVLQVGRASAAKTSHADGVLVPAVRPLDHHSQPENGGMGWALQFAIDWVAANSAGSLILVPCGQGGTGFAGNHWNPGNGHYQDAVARVNDVIAATPGARFGGILWHQGESDAQAGGSAVTLYADRLDALIAGLRADIAAADERTLLICGGLVPDFTDNGPDQLSVNAAIADTPNRVPYTAFVDTSDLDDVGDDLHFDAASYRVMGSRYHAALGSAAANPPRVPGQVTGLVLTPGDGQIAAAWDAPASFGSALSDYLVEYAPEGGDWPPFPDGTGTATTALVTGLVNGTPCEVRVAAVNATGTGAFSAAASATPMAGADPASLFAGGAAGAWYDPSALATLWQDSAGTIPVTADGDPVGRLEDRSGLGHHLTASGAARPTYRSSGGYHWLEFDGSATLLQGATRFGLPANPDLVVAGALRMTSTSQAVVWVLGATGGTGILQGGGLAGDWALAFGNGNEKYGPLATSTESLATWLRPAGSDYAASQFFLDGAEQAATSAANGTNSPTDSAALFSLGGNTAVFGSFRLYGMLVLDTVVSADRALAESWLETRKP